ncbi:MsnO8 family LLM class oxidoreductase [Streptomyces sp. NBC_00103]|uniref:MsnO8 family LLM class oxidoreductase n=1 Tax=Streptomyces sp. NBC_00103 TaxID=2975653 RepID=UPI002258DE4C|nr:MsnO8 family LLM class oxidoreductase [Streptomyces sp. NBC_00103]MCX5372821.1 MsnO8 family LLM class oxidoreductase [Streptomyces sp. NBC_00103]
MVSLSVLDVALVAPGGTARQALHDVVRTAVAADACGYHRFWVAEHHNSPRCAGSSPAVLISHIAAVTHRIRVGSGGVMLTNHAPLTIAEQFAVLQSLHDDRIDLGVGRATGGTDSSTLLDRALRRPPQARAEFPLLLDELVGFLYGRWPGGHAFQDLELSPALPVPPGVFVLGTSENGARTAAARGLPFAYGAHLGPMSRPAALDRYRSAFSPGPLGTSPHVIASVNVQCAETDEEAERLAHDTAAARFRQKHTATSPGVALPEPRERYLIGRMLEDLQLVRGGPATVSAGLRRLAATLGADEIMLVPYDITAAGRERTLRLTAAAWTPPAQHDQSRAAGRQGRPVVS